MIRQLFRNTSLAVGFVLLVASLAVLVGLVILFCNKLVLPHYWRGKANQPGTFTLVVVGDSAAQGLGASRPDYSFVGLLTTRIEQETGQTVRIINLSRSGATVRDALERQAPYLAAYDADLIVLEIGANDMKQYDGSTAEVFAKNYEQLLQILPPDKSIAVDLPVFGGRKNLTRRSDNANQVIRKLATTYNVPVAPLYETLKQHQSPWIYASDLFHPNNRGYRLWYDAIWQAARPLVLDGITERKLDTTQF